MAILKSALFAIGWILAFVWIGARITQVNGEGVAGTLGVGVSVEVGEQVFWGVGKCSTCHAIGTQGRSVRGPNLGQSAIGPELVLRASERAAERSAATGREFTAMDYLIESIAEPSAYVVDGFKNEMPQVWEPPIGLIADQIASVLLYLQTLGGTPDPSLVVLPPEIRDATGVTEDLTAWAPYLGGDSIAGRELFYNADGNALCYKCHTVREEGGTTGPELTNVAGTRTAQFIVDAILQPSVEIAGGYESVLIQTTDGRILNGVIGRETADSLWLADAEGIESALAVADIARRRVEETSLMPGDFAEAMTLTQFHDLLAYLQTLR
jgi:putative heme-binding domain-containing protein